MQPSLCARIVSRKFTQLWSRCTHWKSSSPPVSRYHSPLRDPIPEAHPGTGPTSSEFSFTPTPGIDSLSEEQKYVLNVALAGESLFFTGSAGKQKFSAMRTRVSMADDKLMRLKGLEVAVTASTGLAALNIQGKTLHSFAGVGKGNQHASLLIKKARHGNNIERWRRAQVLVIDEISMVEARWFDVLSNIGKVLRNNPKPFGGMQLIICGDFFQLPPVPEQSYIDSGIPTRFAFQAREWDWAVPNKFRLTRVFRQRDPKLVKMLEDMRMGDVSPASEQLLNTLSREVHYSDGIKPVELFPLRILADSANDRQMRNLPGISVVYSAKDSFTEFVDRGSRAMTPERGRQLLEKLARSRIELKIGAQVMCSKNLPEHDIVNGSIGKIIDFMTPVEARQSRYFIQTIPSDDPNWDPLSQHSNLESVINDLRIRNPNFSWPAIETEGRKWPVVRFDNGTVVLITPTLFTVENVMGKTEACRAQVCQTYKLSNSIKGLKGNHLLDTLGSGLGANPYVGISRCKTLEGLEVLNFSPSIVFAHPSVVRWNKTLVTASSHRKEASQAICLS
ncbi:hypothetical protein OPQ81_001222 [Rhizoctonia solani]|nr:hypothetical protein OPQ81_001222 [Rhizoctonia solani]